MSVAGSAESPLVEALRQAVAAAPDRPEYRLHLAEALIAGGAAVDAVMEIAEALKLDPDSVAARDLMAVAVDRAAGSAPAEAARPAAAEPSPPPTDASTASFDWSAAENDLGDTPQPERFRVANHDEHGPADTFETERPTVTLADVGGLQHVKDRLDSAFLAPMRNPELRRMYGKSLRGGLLLYGPPGCGKTFIARAVAGELGASFVSVGISDVLDMWIGNSERNMHEIFVAARRHAPCVLFFDEIDALGRRRSQLHSSAMRTTVNQFLQELDSVDAGNEGVFVLGATNSPWDVDPALRRPGRFDRTLLVLPPDSPAREEILRFHLQDRPIREIDVPSLAGRTEGYSGADLAHLCESAAEKALVDSIRTGEVRLIGMPDFDAALGELKSSVTSWFEAAKSVALFANEGGAYDDLAAYLREKRLL
ncbi:AAA family ATPase [Embleya sp. NPDC056575]|uniref:AAA family ATPase n=1 Tax=unclassified Embleya TaxID=2699296 RepID=UPI0036AEEDBE